MAEIEADAVNTENEKQREIISSSTQLEIAKSNLDRDRQIAAYQVSVVSETLPAPRPALFLTLMTSKVVLKVLTFCLYV
jgi:hypothetical protein